MKNLFLSVFILIIAASCNRGSSEADSADVILDSAGKPVTLENAPVMKFDKEIYDFGTITEGENVKYEFAFKNTGKSPLIISNATATCGCTVPEYPSKPIKPGESGEIKVVFNSLGRVGIQDKVVTIISNGNPNISNVHLVGEVKAKK